MKHVASETPSDLGQRAEAAMLAAAVGDALGWPQENRSSRVGGRRGVEPELEFSEWRRREGGAYAPHEEVIPAGTYSDDTQLILAVARSLLRGSDWWRYFTTVELPFWPLYQRGGGGATRRAASSWAKGRAPWTDEKTARSYFEAGGNGVAMRVLPHAIRHANNDDFEPAARDILADGITTHGHPRALVGALAYGYCVWFALRRSDTLAYGQLVDEALATVEVWGRRPDVKWADPTWEETVRSSAAASYESVWASTVDEMRDLLLIGREGISRGALAVDRDTLERLGSLGGPSAGAGTITGAAAIFLASRYAARPAQGLLAAAFARGADTDTLASMAGSILGAVNGDDWLGRTLERLQDRSYLAVVARHLVDSGILAPTADGVPQLTPAAIRSFWDKLESAETGNEIVLPDGRLAKILGRTDHQTRSRSNRITSSLVEVGDGQTISLKRVTRVTPENTPPPSAAAPSRRRYRIGVIVEVEDMENSLLFYQDVVGLDITKRSPRYASFAGLLALVAASGPLLSDPAQLTIDDTERMFDSRQTVTIFLPAADLESVRARILRRGFAVSDFSEREGRRMFRCLDPDRHVLEFRELNGG
jgi:ADP-ribosylglycohydrolase/catechol 2,3-dioxygenase-like lactoylglutathione lyase family enzyme